MKKIFLSICVLLLFIASNAQLSTTQIYNMQTYSGNMTNGFMVVSFKTGNSIFGRKISMRALLDSATGGGSGTNNANVGSGFRLVIPSTQEIKTLFAGSGITIDSASNSNGLTITATGGGSSVEMNQIIAATATNDINNATFRQRWQWRSLAGDTALSLIVNSTAAASNAQVGGSFVLKGANGTSAQKTIAGYFENTHTGTTSTNVAARFVASGAATANHAIETDGRVSVNGATVAAGATDAAIMIRGIDNATGGISIAANANYATNLSIGPAQITSTSNDFRITSTGNVIKLNSAATFIGGTTTPTAVLHLAAGTATAGTAPLKLTSGTNLTAIENGTIEYDGTDYFASAGGTRQTIAKGKSGSFSQVGTATTTFTVTFGGTQPNATYKVNVTPTAALSAALFYVTNKSTTSFDVVYLAGLTGSVTFDYSLIN